MIKKERVAFIVATILTLSLCGCGTDTSANDIEEATAAATTAVVDDSNDSITNDTTEAMDTVEEDTAIEVDDTEKAVVSCATVVEDILANVEMSSMAEISADRIEYYLDADFDSASDFCFYVCGSGGFSDEVGVFYLDGIDEDALISAIESRVASRINDFEDYKPDESKKLENAMIETYNGYLLFAVTDDNDTVYSIFKGYVG